MISLMDWKLFAQLAMTFAVAIVGGWLGHYFSARRDLTNEQFSAGCPLVAAAADTAATSEQLRQVLRRAFDGWLEPLSESLAELGVPPERSDNLAIVIIAALEGAIILARIRRDLSPFDALVLELGPLLDAVARPGGPAPAQVPSSRASP